MPYPGIDPFGDTFPIRQSHSPAYNAFAITPMNTGTFIHPTTKVYVGGEGTMFVDMLEDGIYIPFVGISSGTTLDIRITRVYDATSGTTAANIIGLY